ncbi:effector-associated constant component EACC1 [Nocardia pseudovaccinii]|uniref:effector-associated constant component EACC1 n=1 Tax=Nocardia pseudovaccinii TaxID=189540 RepID=UPI0007C83D74|nr:hypothetical protein [Nocardia pseudovaccinii]
MPDQDDQLTIQTTGGSDELFRLLEWFRGDDALRGRVSLPRTATQEGQMGDLSDMLVVAVGAGGLGPALAMSLSAWLNTRRSDIRVLVRRNGVEVELDAKRANAPELVREIQNLLAEPGTPR